MTADTLLPKLAPVATLLLFAATMPYFRQAGRGTRAKAWLVASAGVCAVLQLTTILASTLSAPTARGTAMVLYGCAAALYGWSLATHGRGRPAFAFSPVTPRLLVRAGPYRLVRHPIYTAYLLAWLAGPVLSGEPWLLGTTLCMAAWYYRAARQEEREFAAGDLAEEYKAYRDQAGMFFPDPRYPLARLLFRPSWVRLFPHWSSRLPWSAVSDPPSLSADAAYQAGQHPPQDVPGKHAAGVGPAHGLPAGPRTVPAHGLRAGTDNPISWTAGRPSH
jgi:protein-S-isoprenylcysteine O-methyltransferase Ste14